MPTQSSVEQLERSRKRHNRDVRLQVVLPLIGGGLLIAVLMGFVIVLPRAVQVSLVADLTLMLFMLCPLALCTLPFSIGLFVLAVMSGRLHGLAGKPLRRAEAFSVNVATRSGMWAERVGKASIAFNARLEPITRWMDKAFSGAPSGLKTDKREDDHE